MLTENGVYLLVQAENCGMAAFADGEWKIVDSSIDSEELVDKLNETKKFLDHFDGQAVLITYAAGKGERIIARHNLNVATGATGPGRAQSLTEDEKRQFWRSVRSFALHGPTVATRAMKRTVQRRVEKKPFQSGMIASGLVAAGVAGVIWFNMEQSQPSVGVISEARAASEYQDPGFHPLPHPRDMFGAREPANATQSSRLSSIAKSWGAK